MSISLETVTVIFTDAEGQKGHITVRQQLPDSDISECIINDDQRGFLAVQLFVAFKTQVADHDWLKPEIIRDMQVRALRMVEIRARVSQSVDFQTKAVTQIIAPNLIESHQEPL